MLSAAFDVGAQTLGVPLGSSITAVKFILSQSKHTSDE